MTPRIGSLFSGAGGLDLAVEHVTGGRTVWHCEADPDAAKVLAAHWPDVPNLGDITAVDWSAVEPVDVLCGGFPCQDVSAAGRRAGIASGTRSGLWLEYAEAINQLRPQLVVIENVRGLLSGYAHRAMEPGPDDLGDRSSRPLLRAAGAVLGDLADLGYDAQWTTIAASEVGAPYRRERVFIVAYPAGDRWDEGRSESTRLVGRSHVAVSGNEADRLEAYAEGALLPTPSAADGNGGGRYNSGGHQSTLPGTVRELLPTPAASDGARGPDYARVGREGSGGDDLITTVFRTLALLPTPSACDASGGGQSLNKRQGHTRQLIDYALLDGTRQWGKYEPAIRRWEAITREAPSPTEPGARGNPRLAAPFSEWMQGWPLGWVTAVPISRSAMLRIIGNGVVPQQAIAALYWLLSVCEVAA
ncbi:DNA methylase [Mycobacterium phage prophi104-2]|uniref:DNA (cytosine-5-)-methyltransferase n=1 Tax=Mycobacteroides abscessus TaxID=36809 RepID=UPI0009A8EF04|nr:DNA cytosine methyltransferase [Mycobacteroides abscessus]MBN7563404.1 DNA cytosine methyltransferase [Mycobacteroides abscessus subsp. massiliense]QST89279.1 DNA methylase [Mycobacterium phage prophi104-2]RIS71107.1 DNA cytosine methyltransferase [Mycobacteroides abscessus]SLF12184.1 phage DNA methylase [Mycobacteroides abscessus subsp. massiliense]